MNRLPRRTLLAAAMLTLVAAAVTITDEPKTQARASQPTATSSSTVARAAATGETLKSRGTALMIGDSQSGGAAGVRAEDTWPQRGLMALGYKVTWVGAGGTGFVASQGKGRADNYLNSFEKHLYKLPAAAPDVVVVQGGGNDAGQHKSLEDVSKNAHELIQLIHQRYPSSRILMVGVLSRSEPDGGGARWEVDRLLARIAQDLHVPFVDPGGWVTRYAMNDRMADAVHLKASGHAFLTPVFADAVKTALS